MRRNFAENEMTRITNLINEVVKNLHGDNLREEAADAIRYTWCEDDFAQLGKGILYRVCGGYHHGDAKVVTPNGEFITTLEWYEELTKVAGYTGMPATKYLLLKYLGEDGLDAVEAIDDREVVAGITYQLATLYLHREMK